MSDFTDHEITEAMIVYGGGFVCALGRLFRQADDINRWRLRKAFPEYWEEYRSIAASSASRKDLHAKFAGTERTDL